MVPWYSSTMALPGGARTMVHRIEWHTRTTTVWVVRDGGVGNGNDRQLISGRWGPKRNSKLETTPKLQTQTPPIFLAGALCAKGQGPPPLLFSVESCGSADNGNDSLIKRIDASIS